jgi:hypothetical protein
MSNWLEIWIDGQSPPWVLIVQSSADGIQVFDPQEGRRSLFSATAYETVVNWLSEDEFELVEGRISPDADD